jgi:ParB-like chromosome segregation protein Spo0J
VAKKQLTGLDTLFANITPPSEAPAAIDTFLPLERIRPDSNQPRRILPESVAADFYRTGDTAAALTSWEQTAQSGDDAAAAAYAKLTELAESIAANGLIQPIAVAPDNDHYRILAGERRWWAHLLLEHQGRSARNGKPGYIEAVVRPALNAPHLVENLHREDLCAVEVGVGLSELIAQIEGDELPAPPEERLAALRAVAARRFRPGTWDKVIGLLGKTRPHWTHYLLTLKLPDEALVLALRHRLPEGALRPAVAERDPNRQIALVKAAVRKAQQDMAGRDAGKAEAEAGKRAASDPLPVFRHRIVGVLRGSSRAFDELGDARVSPRALAKELSDDSRFDELQATAKRLLPVLKAITETKPARRSTKAAKAKRK